MANPILGKDCKAYINTGTFAVPVWTELKTVRDVSIPFEKGETDVTTRGNNGWEATAATLKKAPIEFKMLEDTADTNYMLILNDWLGNTTGGLDMAFVNGPIATVGTRGLRAFFSIFKVARSEDLDSAVMVDVSAKPTYNAANPPQWMTAA